MPSLEIPHRHSAAESAYSGEGSMYSEQGRVMKDELIFIDDFKGEGYWRRITGTALLVIGVLNFSSWRRNQGVL
ncbi:hypothetical protein EDC04DRAFT_2792763, partial [Pisolithus marmoratus]